MITDERLATLAEGWESESIRHRGHPADEYANTCEDTAAALCAYQALLQAVRLHNDQCEQLCSNASSNHRCGGQPDRGDYCEGCDRDRTIEVPT